MTLLAVAGPAGAVSFCVSTAAELQADLTAASDNGQFAGQDVEIEIVQGTYKTGAATGNKPFTYKSTAASGEIVLSGGWKPGCAGFSRDARLTILDGGNATQVLNIQNKNDEVDVDFMTIQNGESAVAGGGVSINANVTGGSAYLYDNFIVNNHSSTIGGGFSILGGGNQVLAEGNVVTGNSADSNDGAGFVFSRGGAEAFVLTNTMSKNTTSGSGATGGIYCCGTAGIAEVTANIFWQNTNFGIDMESTNYSFEYNDYGTATGTLNANSTNFSVNPKFVDPDNGNFRLASASPMLGVFASQSFPETDLVSDYYPFPVKGYFDVGAYEDTIFNEHGFENN